MFKKYFNYISLVLIAITAFLSFLPLKPHFTNEKDILNGGFELSQAMTHVRNISHTPHYLGSPEQKKVRSYIQNQLESMGLQTEIQTTGVLNNRNSYSQVNNIISEIKGTDSNAGNILVMSHYDSAAYESRGAADDAAGVAVILESIRNLLESNTSRKNNIVILISDGEEAGLLGAKAFVEQHPLAQNISVVLNMEARGTSGASYMFMETNSGNSGMLDVFQSANTNFPNSHSLAYSIYKLLPNNTDLTVFKDRGIPGYNFAFIDNHFNYHTQRDNADNLSRDSLAHHADNFVSLLSKLINLDLSQLKSEDDSVYFQLPFLQTVSYPFTMTVWITVFNILIFLSLIYKSVTNGSMKVSNAMRASVPLFKAIIMVAFIFFALLKFLYWLHPHYSEILQGFPYNGYRYISFFIVLSLTISYFIFKPETDKFSLSELLFMPVILWLFLGLMFALFLPGAHFFFIISIAATVLFYLVDRGKNQSLWFLILFLIVISVFLPQLVQFPVALGLMSLPITGIFSVLILSVFIYSLYNKESIAIHSGVFIVVPLLIYIYSETGASFNSERPLPDSLYYFQDEDSDKSWYFSHDYKTDKWTGQFFADNKVSEEEFKDFINNHWRWAKQVSHTDNRQIAAAEIAVLNDELTSDFHKYSFKLSVKGDVNRINLVNNNEVNLQSLTINGESIDADSKPMGKNSQLARIYANEETEFEITVRINKDQNLDLSVIEIRPGLLQTFQLPARPKEFMPKPFVVSDTIITKQKLVF